MDRPHWYVLDAKGNPVVETDLLTWAAWADTANRAVAKTQVSEEVMVSTVFLGTDHQLGEGPALLYETMIFGGPEDGFQAKYSTREAALKGHEEAVRLAKAAEDT